MAYRSWEGAEESEARLSLFRVRGSHSLCRTFPDASTRMSGLLQVRNPKKPKSLGLGSSRFARRYSGNLFDFFSSDYLDVSVHRVFSLYLEGRVTRRYSCRVAPFGNLRVIAYLQQTGHFSGSIWEGAAKRVRPSYTKE